MKSSSGKSKLLAPLNCDARPRQTQGTIVALLVTLLTLAVRAQSTEPSTAPAEHRYAAQLRKECHALLTTIHKRPYGWAWTAPADDQMQAERPNQVVMAMDRVESPAAGLILLWSADFLHDAELKNASRQIARAAAAAQQRTGLILRRPLFATNAGGNDERAYIPSRQGSVASLALLLQWVERTDAETKAGGPAVMGDAQIRTAAVRAAGWLVKQQANNGGWPRGHPPDAISRDAIRIIRLDDSDYRDSTIALLLASQITDSKFFAERAKRSAELLTKMRLMRPARSAGLWSTAYGLEGLPLDTIFGFPDGADIVASKYSVQTLIAASIALEEPSFGGVIENAAAALHAAQEPDETWQRWLDPISRRRAPATQSNRAGVTTQPVVDLSLPPGKFNIEPTLAAVAKLHTTNIDRFREDLAIYFTPREHMAAAMAGLIDDPLIEQFPANADQASAYLKQHDEDFKHIDDASAPENFHDSVTRLWWLLVRAKIERQCGT